jgi:aldose 1-epimerase
MVQRLDLQQFFGEVGGQPVALFRLRHASGMEVAVCNLGAKVLQVLVPDRHGHLGDVTLGYDSLAALQAGAPSMGAFIGRYAGRIGQARYALDGVDYPLDANAGAHSLHGGPNGSRHRVYSAHQPTPDSLTLRLRFEPAIDRHPGTVDLCLHYRLTEDHTLEIEHEAVAVCRVSPASPASFTPHIFFNLDGPGIDSVDNHHLQVLADHLLATDADNVATGERTPLPGHVLDLRQPRRLGILPAIDHAYELEGTRRGHGPRRVACAHSPASGRTLEVWTTEPVLQVYTADPLGTGTVPDVGKQGVVHRPRAGLCLEPQQYPNAPNCPDFPLNRVTPGQPYRAITRYRFGVGNAQPV